MPLIQCNCSSAGNRASKQCTSQKNITASGNRRGEDCCSAYVGSKLSAVNETDCAADDADELCMQDFMIDDDLIIDRGEGVYEEMDDGRRCVFFFFFNSPVEA